MKNALFASIVLLYISPLAARPQTHRVEPFGFQDIHLGMSIFEFQAKHPVPKIEKNGSPASPLPGQASCVGQTVGEHRKDMEDAARGIVRCHYSEAYLAISLQVSTMFVDAKLAVIEVEPPYDSQGCFEPPKTGSANSEEYFYSVGCKHYPQLLQALSGNLGPATPIVSVNENLKDYAVWRWEGDSSVAEFQHHMCGPWDGTDEGWSKAILEMLGGTYCGGGDSLSSHQPVMLYLHKSLSRTLATRIAKKTSSP